MIPPEYVSRHAPPPITPGARGRFLLLVLEGGHAFLVRARAALERRDYVAFVADVSRTQDVLVELAPALEQARSVEIAASLGRLHEFLVGDLALSTAERCLDRLDEALRAYGPIVDAYRQAVRAAGTPS